MTRWTCDHSYPHLTLPDALDVVAMLRDRCVVAGNPAEAALAVWNETFGPTSIFAGRAAQFSDENLALRMICTLGLRMVECTPQRRCPACIAARMDSLVDDERFDAEHSQREGGGR